MQSRAHRGHPLQPKVWGTSTYLDRFDALRPHLEGKSVLDLGAGSGHRREDWFHGLVTEVASECVGVDRNEEFVAEANARGADIHLGDAETVRLERTFEVVLAGELIEHLSCFSGLLETAHSHLEADGRLILTTPNAFAVSNFVYRLGSNARVNDEHTCWFCETTLTQLLERHEFAVTEIGYIGHHTPGGFRRALATAVRAPLPPRLAHNTLFAVARPRR